MYFKKLAKKYLVKMLLKVIDGAKGQTRITNYYEDNLTPSFEALYVDGEMIKDFCYDREGNLESSHVIFKGRYIETFEFYKNGMIKSVEFNHPCFTKQAVYEWDENGTCICQSTVNLAKSESDALRAVKLNTSRI